MLSVAEIHFNYPGKSAKSRVLTIRDGPEPLTGITSPEWREGLPSKPVAYVTDDVSEPPSVWARFNGPRDRTVRIRATDGGLLGTAESSEPVIFDSNGESGLIEFTLADHGLAERRVRSHNPRWNWQCDLGSGWVGFQITDHQIFTVLRMPSLPWQQGPTGGDNTQWPWVSALELACQWAMDASTEDEASQMITAALNAQPQFSYDNVDHFLLIGDRFNLSSLLGEVQSEGTIAVNCVDCANIVSTLSNIVGCSLYTMGLTGITLRPILLIGKNGSNPEAWTTDPIDQHEVGWLVAEKDGPFVYDAALQVDVDLGDRDDIHIARLPTKMRFGEYLKYLVGERRSVVARPNYQPKRREVA
jgi:hypothetical protein